jgi:hypothetical protein
MGARVVRMAVGDLGSAPDGHQEEMEHHADCRENLGLHVHLPTVVPPASSRPKECLYPPPKLHVKVTPNFGVRVNASTRRPPRAPPRPLGARTESREPDPRTRELAVRCSISCSRSRQRQSPGKHQKVRDPQEIGIGRPVPVQGHERIGGVTLLEVDRILLEKVLGPACILGSIHAQRRLGGRIRPAHRRSGFHWGADHTPRR